MPRFTALCLSILCSTAMADDSLWKLSFEDQFDRAEIGPDWSFPGKVAKIVDGRLFIDGAGAHVTIQRPFTSDVKIEFEAEANPNVPPCDIAVSFASGSYLLQFGGQNNRVNQIYGYLVDDKPPFLIEHHKVYKCVAVKEGNRLSYTVNGTRILETTVEDVAGGPGFDRVALVTWNGMFVDHVKVYERTVPAPGGPIVLAALPDVGYRWERRKLSYTGPASASIEGGLAAYNAGKYKEAIEAFTGQKPPTLASLAGLAYVLGDLYHDETVAEKDQLARSARALAQQAANDARAADFALAADWFSRITLKSRDEKSCRRLIGASPANNPFYYKAKFYQTRFKMANAKEGADREGMLKAIDDFNNLKVIWPEHLSLREFTGEQVPWGQELIRPESDGPEWARYLQEAFARQQAILNWWATVRQFPTGELGGGWGDDVEILRGWVPAASISSACETAVGCIERLAQGVWDHVLKDGYDPTIGDVEHTAEPSCDALPTMILLRYGDPKWVEFNLRSAKTIREKFMDIDQRGHLRFKSTEFGTDGVHMGLGGGGDTGYHARAMKHHIWLGWYGVPAARDQFLAWCDGWRDLTVSEIGTKPAGFPPASVFYPSGGIDPPTGKPWYDDRSHYYGFSGLPTMIFNSFATAYVLSGERKFLEPIQIMMELATRGPLRQLNSALPPDHMDNLLAHAAHWSEPDLLSVYRLTTKERIYDEYILRHATATQQYQVNYDLDAYTKTFKNLAAGLRYNWTQHTVEVIQTDRAGLAGSAEVLGAYTGAVRDFRDMGAPTMAVTYDTPDLNFAAMVTENSLTRLRVRLYCFRDGVTKIGLRPWRLLPGSYVLNDGATLAGERPFQNRYGWGQARQIEHLHRGTPIYVEVPGHKEWVVDMWLRRPIERPAMLPDLAIASRDVKVAGNGLVVTVHNIGGAASPPSAVVVETRSGETWKESARADLPAMPGITVLEPVRQEVTLHIEPSRLSQGYRVRVDADQKVDELYELNNVAEAGPAVMK